MTAVYVEWFDSMGGGGWASKSTEYKSGLVTSIGWLIEDTDDHITISTSYILDGPNNPEQYESPLTIPKVSIKSWCEIAMKS